MEPVVLVPLEDSEGNPLTDQEAIDRYLSGQHGHIGQYDNVDHLKGSGYRVAGYEGEIKQQMSNASRAPGLSAIGDTLEAYSESPSQPPSERDTGYFTGMPSSAPEITKGLAHVASQEISDLTETPVVSGEGMGTKVNQDFAAALLNIADPGMIGMMAGGRKLTTTALDMIPDSGIFKKSHVENLLKMAKKKGAKDVDVNLLSDTLKQFGDKVPIAEFKQAAEDSLIPLKMEVTDEWKNYGLGNVGRDMPPEDVPEIFRNSTAFDSSETHLYHTPFEHQGAGKHFGVQEGGQAMDTNAAKVTDSPQTGIGHTRIFREKTPEGEDVKYISEIQSDAVQDNRYKPPVSPEEYKQLEEEGHKLIQAVPELDRLDNQLQVNPDGTSEAIDVLFEQLFPDESKAFSDRPAVWKLTKMEELINDRANQIAARMNRGDVAPKGFEQFDPYIYQRMIREENAESVIKGDARIRIATPRTEAKIEGWRFNEDGKPIDRNAPQYKRQQQLNKFVQKEYGADLVEDDKGFTWYEWTPTENTTKAFSLGTGGVVGGVESPKENDKQK